MIGSTGLMQGKTDRNSTTSSGLGDTGKGRIQALDIYIVMLLLLSYSRKAFVPSIHAIVSL